MVQAGRAIELLATIGGSSTRNRHSSARPPAPLKASRHAFHQRATPPASGSTTSTRSPLDARSRSRASNAWRASSGSSFTVNAASSSAGDFGNATVDTSARPFVRGREVAIRAAASASAHGWRSMPTICGRRSALRAHAAPAAPVPQPRSTSVRAAAVAPGSARTISRSAGSAADRRTARTRRACRRP